MDCEVGQKVGAARYERTPQRMSPRKRYRTRPWDVSVGSIMVRVPKLRGSAFRESSRARMTGTKGDSGGESSWRLRDTRRRRISKGGAPARCRLTRIDKRWRQSRSEISRFYRTLDGVLSAVPQMPTEGQPAVPAVGCTLPEGAPTRPLPHRTPGRAECAGQETFGL